jgi:hypothetical protein
MLSSEFWRHFLPAGKDFTISASNFLPAGIPFLELPKWGQDVSGFARSIAKPGFLARARCAGRPYMAR